MTLITIILISSILRYSSYFVRELCFNCVINIQSIVFFEPTDRRKACKPFHESALQHQLAYSSPNISELRAMANFIKPCTVDNSSQIKEIIELSKIVSQNVSILIITLGSKGVMIVKRITEQGNKFLHVHLYPGTVLSHVENVSGAGDCFSSGFINGTLLGLEESRCVSMGFEAAKHALLCKQTVPLKFNFSSNLEVAEANISKYEIN